MTDLQLFCFDKAVKNMKEKSRGSIAITRVTILAFDFVIKMSFHKVIFDAENSPFRPVPISWSSIARIWSWAVIFVCVKAFYIRSLRSLKHTASNNSFPLPTTTLLTASPNSPNAKPP